ncbi:ArsC/Spx/MgsR family protein [Stutzerimonas kirkiae]|uniref:Arsenate reductase family protein n=1 Tax=Stutzerimonas kirkiae TaxID=2211392 RepID=A0A4Q9RCC5_9GAMM|nr:ArsC/Spx/MgsR family protein [Stutzerimonas kirkiae]TBU98800.1 arsenate reductase family protein [Stutzerimonas kirkiae]TBV03894.1 arsenate reductase family protein [Stutzerimonas kirkiae]TBV09692.1 arsenate reductase family protein [Stutzerimonas kirkiae]TBV16774.1 arsenate reductase family protein [Stutzerimonas kirkiae]
MSCIVFYEKPGCATNGLQKRLLRAAGLQLEVRDLLSEPWSRERLRPFFGERPVAEWFNLSAPAIKHGEVAPHTLDSEQALALMLAQPLLIRRPLLQYGEQRMVGFDPHELSRLLPGQDALARLPADLDGCRHGSAGHGGNTQASGGAQISSCAPAQASSC